MKLIVQIPCLDEEETLPATIADLPRQIEGIDAGRDARDRRRLDRPYRRGRPRARGRPHRPADQQQGPCGRLPGRPGRLPEARRRHRSSTPTPTTSTAARTSPSWSPRSWRARQTWSSATATSAAIEHFSGPKKALQRLGSWVVRRLSGTEIADATSGFRAYSREAALELLVVDNFTYTLESLIQAGKKRRRRRGPDPHQPQDPRIAALRLDLGLRPAQRPRDPAHLRPVRAAEGLYRPWPDHLLLALLAWLPFLVDWIAQRRPHRPCAIPAARRGPLHRRHPALRPGSDRRPAGRTAGHDPACLRESASHRART